MSDPLALVQRRFERERSARKQAEQITEGKTRELYLANLRLGELNAAISEKSALLEAALEEARQRAEEARLAQAELVRRERLASLGQLVAGVAHEINTPLGVGVTATSLLREKVASLEELFEQAALKKGDLRRFLDETREVAEILRANLDRASTLVRNFKEVAVDQAGQERRQVDLGVYLEEVLSSLVPMVRRAPSPVAIEIQCPPGLELRTCPGVISQIVTNLVTNAIHHASQPGRTTRVLLDVARDTEDVLLAYSDDGRGMPPEVLGRVFDPFFTTRRGSGGSGLGMHVVHNLVTEVLKGRISAWSEPGRGARFEGRFPAELESRSGEAASGDDRQDAMERAVENPHDGAARGSSAPSREEGEP